MAANFTEEVGVDLASAFNSVTSQPIPAKNPSRNPLQIKSRKNGSDTAVREAASNIFLGYW